MPFMLPNQQFQSTEGLSWKSLPPPQKKTYFTTYAVKTYFKTYAVRDEAEALMGLETASRPRPHSCRPLTTSAATMLKLSAAERWAVEHFDDSDGAVNSANEQRVGGQTQATFDQSFTLRPRQCSDPVWLDIQVSTLTAYIHKHTHTHSSQ